MRRFSPATLLAPATLITLSLAGCSLTFAQNPPATQPATLPDDPLKILTPTLNKKENSLSIPAAFWNQKMTSWVEVAICGRPSDFLHETIACTTTTKNQMSKSLRDIGFRDADYWVANVQDFPRIRGDRALVLLEFTTDNKKQTYALDELLCFQGWGVPAGPYGWMFKGDPDRNSRPQPAAVDPTKAPAEPEVDRTKIIRDDPQIALAFKGLQHLSQSYIDNPLAYDNWIYPMMRYSRNYQLLSDKIYDSNGTIPVTLTIRKVNEEQFLTAIAQVWHDEKFSKYALEKLPVAKSIDTDKAALEKLLPHIQALLKVPTEKRDIPAEDKIFGQAAVLAANIESHYATLDAAWAAWAAEHPVYESTNNAELEELRAQTKLWNEHRELLRQRASHLATAEQNGYLAKMLTQENPVKNQAQIARHRGLEIAARSRATLAEITHPTAYWKYEKSRIDGKDDPRTDWIAHITIQNDLLAAKTTLANAGIAYGKKLQEVDDQSAPILLPLQRAYAAAIAQIAFLNLRVELADVTFEIVKREMLENDPELPALQLRKKELEAQIQDAVAATQPALK